MLSWLFSRRAQSRETGSDEAESDHAHEPQLGDGTINEAAGRDAVEELLHHPPEACRQTAAMWERSRRAVVQTPIKPSGLFAYWIHRLQLHEVERRQLEGIYAQLDSETLNAMGEAIREFRQNPAAVWAFVEALREAELNSPVLPEP
jgi:hypothetical protein